MIDWSLNISSLMQMAALIATVVGLFYGIRGEVRILRHDVVHIEERLAQLSESFKQLSSVLTQVAVQDTRITQLEKMIDDLRRGQGYVFADKKEH